MFEYLRTTRNPNAQTQTSEHLRHKLMVQPQCCLLVQGESLLLRILSESFKRLSDAIPWPTTIRRLADSSARNCHPRRPALGRGVMALKNNAAIHECSHSSFTSQNSFNCNVLLVDESYNLHGRCIESLRLEH